MIRILFWTVGILPCSLLAQAPPASNYRSLQLGQPVSEPEALSGVWEAPDGQGGAVGIHLQLTTTVPANVTTLIGVEQSWFRLQVAVFQRKGAEIQIGEQNYFMDTSPGSHLKFEQGRLTLRFAPSGAGLPAVDLDLTQQSDGTWEGRFHRGTFDSRIKLLRPGLSKQQPPDLLVGAWLEDPGSFPHDPYCLHVAQKSATEWAG